MYTVVTYYRVYRLKTKQKHCKKKPENRFLYRCSRYICRTYFQLNLYTFLYSFVWQYSLVYSESYTRKLKGVLYETKINLWFSVVLSRNLGLKFVGLSIVKMISGTRQCRETPVDLRRSLNENGEKPRSPAVRSFVRSPFYRLPAANRSYSLSND